MGNDDSRGFALLGLIMILLVVGALVGFGANLIKPIVKKEKFNKTNEVLGAAIDSVTSYAAGNDKLPIYDDGVTDSTINEFEEVVKNPNDPFTKGLAYIYDHNLAGATGATVCGRKTTALTVNSTANVAFAVISGSDDYAIDSSRTTSGAFSGTVTVSVDDMAKWVTLDELRIKAGCIGSPVKIVNNELPKCYLCSDYVGTVFAEGGVPFASGGNYKWCRQESSSTGLTFAPSVLDTDCSGLAESSWTQSDTLVISSSPTTPTVCSAKNLTFFARDNNDSTSTEDNMAQKRFDLTILDIPVSVINSTGIPSGYKIDGGSCQQFFNNASVSISSSQSIEFFENISCITVGSLVSCPDNGYCALQAYDTNLNCTIQLTNIADGSCSFSDS